MSGAPLTTSLQQRWISGINTDVAGNVSFTTDDLVVYVGGHTIVLYSLTDRRQRFLNGAEITEKITAFSSGSGRRLAAVAERGDRPQVHIFDLRTFRRKKTITTSESVAGSKDIVCVSFSEDEQFLLTLTGAPDWTLTSWNWAKAKVVASTQASLSPDMVVNQCMYSPLDVSVAVCCGNQYVRFFRVVDKEIRMLQETHMPEQNFTSMCWMRSPDDHVLAGTESGEIFMFRAGILVMSLPCAPGPQFNMPVTCISSMRGGFIAGSGPGTLFFFSYDESRDQALFDDQFQLMRQVTTDLFEGMALHVALCPADEKMCVLTSDGQLLTASLLSIPTLTSDQLTHTVAPFHGPKAIVGLDVCVRKSLFITISKDKSLRLWNFATHTLELVQTYGEEMSAVALHPTGLQCAVAFTDKLRLFHLLVDGLRVCMEVPMKGVREMRFSTGGNFLAVAYGNSIIIFNCHTGERVADLRGHNSKVRSLQWNDTGSLLSCGQDGAVYLWDIEGNKRLGEYVLKGTVFTSAAFQGESVFVSGNDRSLRELAMPDLAPFKSQDSGILLSNLALVAARSVLFSGSADHARPGYVRAYSYPTTGDFDDYPCGGSHVTKLRVTHDEGFLITGDDQGILCVFELRDRNDRFQRAAPTAPPDLSTREEWSDEILVARAELEDRDQTILDLHAKVDELKLHNEYQLKLKEMNNTEKTKEYTDKFVQELEQARTRLDLLKEECLDLEVEQEERIKSANDKHQNMVQKMEMEFQAVIMDCVNAHQQLCRDRDAQIERLEKQRKQLVMAHERYVDELVIDYEGKIEDARNTRLRYEDECSELGREMEEKKLQLEDDVDTEIDNIRTRFEKKMLKARETTLKYKGENGIMKKKFSVLQRELEDMKEETRALLDKEKELHESIKQLEKEVSGLKKEIKARDISIGDKEKRIYELKKKNQELDKFKFVLDFKIRELKEQIEPRQLEIAHMREKIKDMDDELEKYHKSNANLDEVIGAVRGRIDELLQETAKVRGNAKLQESNITTLRSEVQLAIADILDPPKLLVAIGKLVKEFHADAPMKPRIDPEVEGEYGRHKEFLVKSIAALKKSLEDGVQSHIAVNSQLMSANMQIINEIDTQRAANRQVRNALQADIGRLRQMVQAREQAVSLALKKANANTLSQLPETMKVVEEYKEPASAPGTARGGEVDPSSLLERNRHRIIALRAAIAELESRRVTSLPPIERIAFYTQAQSQEELQSPRPATGTAAEDLPGSGFESEEMKLPPLGGGEVY